MNSNETTIDIGECETILRKSYNISNESLLYIKKIDVFQEGMKIPKIEYDLYSKISGENLTKLNLTICKGIKVYLSIPIKITESIDELNTSSKYYNDICYPATSENDTDIILKDRAKEFVEKNKTLCQEECTLDDYNYTSQKAKCKCDIKESSSKTFDEIVINATKLYDNFKDIKNLINISILKCYGILSKKKSIIYNVGSYTLFIIITFHTVSFIVFFIVYKKQIKETIELIFFALKNLKKEKEEGKTQGRLKKKDLRKKKKTK